jgi:hypothetical protein
MDNRVHSDANGSAGKGLIDACHIGQGCTLFIPNPKHAPLVTELHIAFTEVLQK